MPRAACSVKASKVTWWLQEWTTKKPPGAVISAHTGHLAVTPQALASLFGFGERGRIQIDQIEGLFVLGAALQDVEHVGLNPIDTQIIQPGAFLGQFEGRSTAVHASDASTGGGHGQRKATGITVPIKARGGFEAVDQAGQQCTGVALVIEPTGLLAAGQRGDKAQTVFFQHHTLAVAFQGFDNFF